MHVALQAKMSLIHKIRRSHCADAECSQTSTDGLFACGINDLILGQSSCLTCGSVVNTKGQTGSPASVE